MGRQPSSLDDDIAAIAATLLSFSKTKRGGRLSNHPIAPEAEEEGGEEEGRNEAPAARTSCSRWHASAPPKCSTRTLFLRCRELRAKIPPPQPEAPATTAAQPPQHVARVLKRHRGLSRGAATPQIFLSFQFRPQRHVFRRSIIGSRPSRATSGGRFGSKSRSSGGGQQWRDVLVDIIVFITHRRNRSSLNNSRPVVAAEIERPATFAFAEAGSALERRSGMGAAGSASALHRAGVLRGGRGAGQNHTGLRALEDASVRGHRAVRVPDPIPDRKAPGNGRGGEAPI